ncbi:MAG: hypothetical protein ACPGXL_09680 [Chitinophagales bacterium]
MKQFNHTKSNFTSKIALPLFFAAFLVLGLMIVDDYGISYDEHIQRKHGLISFDYINAAFGHPWGEERLVEDECLPDYIYRNYGVVFQLSNLILENVLGLEDARDWYLLRHLSNFLLFWVACIFFYKLLYLRFNHWQFALLGTIFLILSPRIFANAFFNPKDMVLLPWYIISGYTMICFLLRKNTYFAIVHGITTAFVMNARIPGLVIFALTLGFIVLEYLQVRFYAYKPEAVNQSKETTELAKIAQLVNIQQPYRLVNTLRLLSIYVVVCALITFLIWPSLWETPFSSFAYIFSSMSHFNGGGNNLYYGDWMLPTEVPWHYGLGWMFVTTPIVWFALSLGGVIAVLGLVKRAIVKRQFYFFHNAKEYVNLILLGLFLAPLLIIILLKSHLYNGWRHLYFIYPPFLALGMIALWQLSQWTKRKDAEKGNRLRQLVLSVTILMSIGIIGIDMIKTHPHQNMYFSFVAGGNIDERFDQEYWGLSSKQALEHLLKIDSSAVLKVKAATWRTKANRDILPPEDRKRIHFVSFKKADYFISHHRRKHEFRKFHSNKHPYNSPIYEIKVEDRVIGGIYKTR